MGIKTHALGPAEVVLVGNKCDLPEESWAVSRERGQELAQQLNLPFLLTSAKEDTNISDMFLTVVERVVDRMERDGDFAADQLGRSTGGVVFNGNQGGNDASDADTPSEASGCAC